MNRLYHTALRLDSWLVGVPGVVAVIFAKCNQEQDEAEEQDEGVQGYPQFHIPGLPYLVVFPLQAPRAVSRAVSRTTTSKSEATAGSFKQ